MKKLILSALALTLLCGCTSQNNSPSRNGNDTAAAAETTGTAVQTTATGAKSVSGKDSAECTWFTRGVYEVMESEEQNTALSYDNRFKGEFYVFTDETKGEYWSAYNGKLASFRCDQEKNSIAFHETNIWEHGSRPIGSRVDMSYSKGTDHDFGTDEDGNVVFRSYGRFMFALVKRDDLDPDTFDATDYKGDFVLSEHGWLEKGSYAYKGKKVKE